LCRSCRIHGLPWCTAITSSTPALSASGLARSVPGSVTNKFLPPARIFSSLVSSPASTQLLRDVDRSHSVQTNLTEHRGRQVALFYVYSARSPHQIILQRAMFYSWGKLFLMPCPSEQDRSSFHGEFGVRLAQKCESDTRAVPESEMVRSPSGIHRFLPKRNVGLNQMG
jgi:hypothetical protein